jgi:hypothetical protein
MAALKPLVLATVGTYAGQSSNANAVLWKLENLRVLVDDRKWLWLPGYRTDLDQEFQRLHHPQDTRQGIRNVPMSSDEFFGDSPRNQLFHIVKFATFRV